MATYIKIGFCISAHARRRCDAERDDCEDGCDTEGKGESAGCLLLHGPSRGVTVGTGVEPYIEGIGAGEAYPGDGVLAAEVLPTGGATP